MTLRELEVGVGSGHDGNPSAMTVAGETMGRLH